MTRRGNSETWQTKHRRRLAGVTRGARPLNNDAWTDRIRLIAAVLSNGPLTIIQLYERAKAEHGFSEFTVRQTLAAGESSWFSFHQPSGRWRPSEHPARSEADHDLLV